MRKILCLLVALTFAVGAATASAAVGDAWSLSGDMQNVSNPGPVVNGGQWAYHNGGPLFTDPAIVANNVNPEVPDAGIGWVNPAGNWMMLVKFTVDANPVPPIGTGDDKTNFLTGDVGGHASTGATWTTDHAGVFQIDWLGYNARNPDTAQTHEIGRTTQLILKHNGAEIDNVTIANFFESSPGVFDIPGYAGSANAYTNSVVLNLAAGDVIDLAHAGNDWSGLDMTITEIPEPATLALLGLGSLFTMRRRKH